MSHVDDGQIEAFLDGELESIGDDSRWVEAHLRRCATCRDRCEEARREREAARRLLAVALPDDEVPPFRSIAAKAPGHAGVALQAPGRRTAVIAAVWAASIAAALGAGWFARELANGERRAQGDVAITPTGAMTATGLASAPVAPAARPSGSGADVAAPALAAPEAAPENPAARVPANAPVESRRQPAATREPSDPRGAGEAPSRDDQAALLAAQNEPAGGQSSPRTVRPAVLVDESNSTPADNAIAQNDLTGEPTRADLESPASSMSPTRATNDDGVPPLAAAESGAAAQATPAGTDPQGNPQSRASPGATLTGGIRGGATCPSGRGGLGVTSTGRTALSPGAPWAYRSVNDPLQPPGGTGARPLDRTTGARPPDAFGGATPERAYPGRADSGGAASGAESRGGFRFRGYIDTGGPSVFDIPAPPFGGRIADAPAGEVLTCAAVPYAPYRRADITFFVGSALADSVLAGPGTVGQHAVGDRPIYGQIVVVESVGGLGADAVEQALARRRDRSVVVVPWDHRDGCRIRPWPAGARFVEATEPGFFTARLRHESGWVGGMPTFDVLYADGEPYPHAGVYRSAISGSSGPESAGLLTPAEYFELYALLPDRDRLRSDPVGAAEAVLRWERANPDLARRFPANAIISELRAAVSGGDR